MVRQNKKFSRIIKRHPTTSIFALLTAGAIAGVVVVAGPDSPSNTSPGTPIPEIKSAALSNANETTSDLKGKSDKKPQSKTVSSPAATATPIVAPYGAFVSNHSPSLTGAKEESSVCNTTPGTVCYIEFSKASTTKRLASKLTDGGGAAFWKWDVKAAGLTAGDWKITAVATGAGKTKSTADPLLLQVKP